MLKSENLNICKENANLGNFSDKTTNGPVSPRSQFLNLLSVYRYFYLTIFNVKTTNF